MKTNINKVDVVCIGMSCADIMIPGVDLSCPLEEEMTPVKQISIYVGGDATNQSMVMSQLGLRTKLLTGVGKDSVGELLENTVRSCGVDTSGFFLERKPPHLSNGDRYITRRETEIHSHRV